MRPSAELAWLLDGLRPAELPLRDWVRTRLNASIVREIALLDHGKQVEEHRRGIEELLVVNQVPQELPWNPAEVLELASHEPLNGKQLRPEWAGERGQVARLFCCLVLVRADDTHVPAAKLAQLIESEQPAPGRHGGSATRGPASAAGTSRPARAPGVRTARPAIPSRPARRRDPAPSIPRPARPRRTSEAARASAAGPRNLLAGWPDRSS